MPIVSFLTFAIGCWWRREKYHCRQSLFPNRTRAIRCWKRRFLIDLPLIWEPIAAAEGKFVLTTLRNDRDHYYRTLRLWEQNLLARYAEAIELVGESTVADFRRYLRLSATGFRAGIVSLLRMSFQKKD